MNTDKFLDAFEFAVQAHGFQKRKYTNEPYIAHPIRVAQMVACTHHKHDDDVIIAALLHDVVEDTEYTLTNIDLRFGWRVRMFVEELTDEPLTTGNRKTRKVIDNLRLANASAASQTIKCADIIDNTDSIVNNDPGFGKRYIEEKKVLLPLLTQAVDYLYAEATLIVFQAEMRLKGLTGRTGMMNNLNYYKENFGDSNVGC